MSAVDDAGLPAVKGSEQLLLLIIGLFVLLKACLLVWYAWNSPYIMDEYAQVGHTAHVADGSYRSDEHPFKTVFYAYAYYPARLIGATSSEVMRGARIETYLILLLVVWQIFLAARKLGYDRLDALFACVVFLAFSNVMQHGFRARSDSVALLFEVAAFAVICAAGRSVSGLHTFVAGALVGLGFITTQKAAYAAVAMGAGLTAALLAERSYRRLAVAGLACLAGFGAVLVAYAIGLGGLRFASTMAQTFTKPIVMIVEEGQAYADIRSPYILQTLRRNPIPYGLCVVGLVFAVSAWRSASLQKRFAVVFTMVFTALVFTNNQPWPYVFVSAATFLAIWASDVSGRLRGRIDGRSGVIVAVLVLALAFSVVRDFRYTRRSNALQNLVSDRAESLLRPSDRYQDGIGMITTRQMAPEVWWDRLNVLWAMREVGSGDYHFLDSITSKQPKLWIHNYRIDVMWPIISPIINRSYVRVDPNIHLTGAEIGITGTWFINRWAGSYALYDSHGAEVGGSFVLNGREARSPVDLRLTTYRVSLLRGSPPRYLLPAGLKFRASLPVASMPRALFVDVYE